MRLAGEKEKEGVKAGDRLARFVRGDLFLELFSPDLLILADVVFRDVHGSDSIGPIGQAVGGGVEDLPRLRSAVG